MNLYKSELQATLMNGKNIDFSSYEGKILLIVNTASKCGFTPQFKGLEELYNIFKNKEFLVLGFPCNQFKNQDPEENTAILEFCQINYGVTFPMFQKINVNGPDRNKLYQYLIDNNIEKKHGNIKWNFEKFLINRNGEIIKRYPSLKKPKSIKKDIETLL